VTGSRTMGSEETKDPVRKLGVRVFALTISVLTGQRVSDTTFGLRAMRSEVTGVVRLEQPQYQAAELLIGVITHGFRVQERPATIHRRTVGKSKKGNNAFYALRFSEVVLGTWWRERQRRVRGVVPESAVRPGDDAPGLLADDVTVAGTGPSAPGATWPAGSEPPPDPRSAKST
jgi:hypothetical protein